MTVAASKKHPVRAVLARTAVVGRLLAAALLAAIALLVFGQVAARNLMDLGLPWADELARFCGVSLVFLAIPDLARRGMMVAVTLVPDMAPPSLRLMLERLAALALLAFAAALLWGFHAYLPRAGKFSTPAMGMPNWIFYGPALIGTLLLAAAAVERLVSPDPEHEGPAPQ